MTLKKGRVRRAKAKAARTTNVYRLRTDHLAIQGHEPFFIIDEFKPQTAEELKEITLTLRHPPTYHGVIFDYGADPCSPTSP